MTGLDRVCPHCLNAWPATGVYFAPRKDRRGGLDSWCRACVNDTMKALYHRRKAAAGA